MGLLYDNQTLLTMWCIWYLLYIRWNRLHVFTDSTINGGNWTNPWPLTALFIPHGLRIQYELEKTRKETQLILIELTFLPLCFVSKCIQNCHSLSVLVVLQSDVCGFLKASFLTTNYQPACSGLENECDSGINLHLNIWCPDNKISQHHVRNAINSCSAQIVIRLVIIWWGKEI